VHYLLSLVICSHSWIVATIYLCTFQTLIYCVYSFPISKVLQDSILNWSWHFHSVCLSINRVTIVHLIHLCLPQSQFEQCRSLLYFVVPNPTDNLFKAVFNCIPISTNSHSCNTYKKLAISPFYSPTDLVYLCPNSRIMTSLNDNRQT